ncbi:MAG: chaperonin GroEL [Chloroflexi bacterium]|nr:chaperonin GroEL [Chloroflexota bacterium]
MPCANTASRSEHTRPRILYGDTARAALERGIDRMASLAIPTLGPIARTVAIESVATYQPEVLDSGGVIARRTIQLPDPFEDMGAMLMRHLLITLLERVGDGTTTAAALTNCLVPRLLAYTARGGNVVEIRRGLDAALDVAAHALETQAVPIEGIGALEDVAVAAVRDRCIGESIAQIYDATGPDGAIIVENGQASETTFEFIEGVRWNEGLVSDTLLRSPDTAVRLVEPRILITDCELESTEQLLPLLEDCVAAGERRLFIVAAQVRAPVIALLSANQHEGVLESVAAVRAPSMGNQREGILADLAVLTGGRFIRAAAGGLAGVAIRDLGRARQAWATRAAFGVLGGRGSRAAVRERVAIVQAERARAAGDLNARSMAQQRIARLLGLGAVIRVGAASDLEREEIRVRTEAAITTTRLALEEGVVAGGGAALVACAEAVRACRLSGDAGVAAEVLAGALEAPMRTIVRNAGFEAEPLVAVARRCAPGRAFDVVRNTWVEPQAMGLVDPLAVLRAALEASVSISRTAMSTEVLVRRRQVAPPPGR